jgi:SAM-dependent methyltransferase
MNWIHRRYCGSPSWAAFVASSLLPWGLDGLDLGDEVVEVGPGLGVTTRLLAGRVPRLVAIEVEEGFVAMLERELGGAVEVVHGDGSAMPFDDGRFSAVVCFTVLHHVPSPALQDRLFAEAFRVLRPGGVFAGTDSLPNLRFRLIHLFDTMVTVDPATLPARLEAPGFGDVEVATIPRRVRFRARKSLPAGA